MTLGKSAAAACHCHCCAASPMPRRVPLLQRCESVAGYFRRPRNWRSFPCSRRVEEESDRCHCASQKGRTSERCQVTVAPRACSRDDILKTCITSLSNNAHDTNTYWPKVGDKPERCFRSSRRRCLRRTGLRAMSLGSLPHSVSA